MVVNLAGAGVFDKLWTTSSRELILSSRVNTTGTLARTLVDLADTGSAPGADPGQRRRPLRHRPDRAAAHRGLPAANDFLAQVTWSAGSAPTEPAAAAGVRVVLSATSPVLDRSGGAFR